MLNHAHAFRNAFIAGVALVTLILPMESQAQTDCAAGLATTSGFTNLANGESANRQRKVDEWDGEVLKIRTELPGILVVEGSGPALQNTIYTDASSGPYPLLDSAQLGTTLPELQTIVPAGDQCVQVTPGVGEDDFEVHVTFIDVCHIGDPDDHGDSLVCASPVTVDDEGGVAGEITSYSTIDIDRFSFALGLGAEVVIESTGDTDVEATLYEEDGDVVASDDDSGADDNFLIDEELGSGKYYVRVKGANGSYNLTILTVPEP